MRSSPKPIAVRVCLRAAVLLFVFCLVSFRTWAQPTNDNFASAALIEGLIGTFDGDNTDATKEAGEAYHAGNVGGASIWYMWTAPIEGVVTFDTLGSEVDTLLAVYEGNSYSTLVSMAQNDDFDPGNKGPSQVQFWAHANTTYRIAVDGAGGASGVTKLSWHYYSAGEFRFTQDTYLNIKGDASRPVWSNMSGDKGARVTVTREKGDAGAVNVSLLVTPWTYFYTWNTNQTDGSNICFDVQADVITNYCTNDFTGTVPWENFLTTNAVIVTNCTTNVVAGVTNVDCSEISIYDFTTNGVLTNFHVIEYVQVDINTNSTNLFIAREFIGGEPYTNIIKFRQHQLSAFYVMPIITDTYLFSQTGQIIARPTTNGLVSQVEIIDAQFDPLEDIYTNDIAPPVISSNRYSATVDVKDDSYKSDTNGVPKVTFNFERSRLSVSEGDTALVTVWRNGAPDGANVNYRINFHENDEPDSWNFFGNNPGSDFATPDAAEHLTPADYTPVSGSFTWGQNDYTGRTIAIPILNDGLVEFNEDFEIELWLPDDNAARIGDGGSCIVTIKFNDQPAGSVDRGHLTDSSSSFEPPNYPTPGANRTVFGLAVQPDNKTVIGGEFTSVNGTSINYIARLLDDGRRDTSFNPGSGFNAFVSTLALDSTGNILAGGAFTSFNGVQRRHIARVTASGALDTTFNPGAGANGFVWSLAPLANNQVLIAGDFTAFNNTNRMFVARLNSNGSLDTTFDPGNGPDDIVWSVVGQPDGKVIIGGDFTSVNGVPRAHIARLNADGSVDSTFDPVLGVDGPVYAMALQPDGKLIIGGDFRNVNVIYRGSLARLNTDGSVDSTFDPAYGTDGTVYSILLQPDGRVLVGGAFTTINGTRRVGVARLLANGAVDTSFMEPAYNTHAGVPQIGYNPELYPKNAIYSMALQADGKVMIGGSFTEVGGGSSRDDIHPRNHVARLIGGDTEGAGTLQFASSSYSVDENDAQNYITLERVNGSLGSVAASFVPQHKPLGPGVAQYGVDFKYTETFYTQKPGGGPLIIRDAFIRRIPANRQPEIVPFDDYYGNYRVNTPGYLTAPTYFTGYDQDSGLEHNIGWMLSYGRYGPNNSTTCLDTRVTQRPYANVNLMVPRNGIVDGNRTADLQLVLPNQMDLFYLGGENIPLGAALGRSRATLNIVDADTQPGSLAFASSLFTVNENGGSATITVTRTNGSDGTVTVRYATTNSTVTPQAVAGTDYSSVSGTLTFRQGETVKSFSVPIIDNTQVQSDRYVGLRLFNPTGGANIIAPSNSFLLIIDDDFSAGRVNFQTLTTNTVPTNYVHEGDGTAAVLVTRTGGSAGTLSVQYATSNRTATAGINYGATSGTLFWNSGETASKTINIPIYQDGVVGGVETNRMPDGTLVTGQSLNVRLFNTVVAGVTNSQALGAKTNSTLFIIDDDAYGALQFTGANLRVSEGAGRATITVVRRGGSAQTVSVNYLATNGTAISPIDFDATSGTLTFAPGETAKTFDITIKDDYPPQTQGNRTVALQLSGANPASALGSQSSAILTIVDNESFNEPPGSTDTTYNPSAGANGLIYSAVLQPDGKLLIGGDFTTVNGIARSRIARMNVDGSLDLRFSSTTLGADAPIRTILPQTDGRVLVGGDFTVINGVNRSFIGRLNSDGTIDGYFDPGAGADNPVYAVAETFSGTNRFVLIGGGFTSVDGIPRSGIARLTDKGTVDTTFAPGLGVNGPIYAIAVQSDGKIIIGGDFTTVNGVPRNRLARLRTNGSLDTAFNASANGLVRAVKIQYDGRILVGGVFTSVNGAAANHIGRLNIDGTTDNSFAPGLGLNDTVYAIEQQLDSKIVLGGEFTLNNGVTRNRITRLNVNGSIDPTINFGSGANNFVSALAVQTDGKIILAGGFTEYNGATHQRLARIFGDAVDGTGFIEFISGDYTVDETGTNAVITLRRIGGTKGDPFTGNVSIQFSTSDGTANAGSDYVGIVTNIVFPLGETFRTVMVPITDDSLIETDETVQLSLSTVPGDDLGQLGGQPTAMLTIVDDDSAISFATSTFRGQENAINGTITLNLARMGSTRGTASVEVVTIGNGTATAGADYTPVTNLVVFGVGETNKTTSIPVLDDTAIEGDETFDVQLRNGAGAFLLSPTIARVTVVDNDFGPGVLSFTAPSFSISEAGTNVLITIVRTNGASGFVSVNFSTANGTAIAGVDYSATNGVLTFGDGDTSKTVPIRVFDDAIAQGTRTFFFSITNAPGGGATIVPPSTVSVDILDNEVGIRFATPAFVVSEGGLLTVNVLRDNGSNGVASVNYSVVPSNPTNATPGVDYTATSGTLTFNSGETVKSFTVSTIQDALIEGDETFQLRLSNPTGNATLMNPSNAIVTIVDNDSAFYFSTNNYSLNENGSGAVITVIRTNANSGAVSVRYATGPGAVNPATAGVDYTSISGTLNFADGETSKTFMVPILDDFSVEGDETITLTLSNPSSGTQLLSPSSATLTIVDNDAGFAFSSSTYSVQENGVSATISVRRTGITNNSVAVDYSTANGSAAAGLDYQPASGTLFFLPGETNKTFTVTIIDNTVEDGDRTVLLKLSNPAGNASLLNPNAATLTIVDNDGSTIRPAGSQIVSENSPANGIIDTNETVTILLALRNAGSVNTTNLVATLQSTNGVTSPSGPANYGGLIAGGPSVSRQFTFTASGTNGAQITATLQLQDGAQSLGRASFTFVLGTSTLKFTNSAAIILNDNTNASPYPSTILVSGVNASVAKATVTLNSINHGYPADIDVLLVGPSGEKTMLMAGAGSGNNPLNNVTLSFDDSAANALPASGQITAGTYRPSNYLPLRNMAAPAPARPYGTNFAAFSGANPNGTWSLYADDNTQLDAGNINGGWVLSLISATPVPKACDLSLTVSGSPNPVSVSNNVTYTITVTNHGPSSASGIVISNAMPSGATFVSASGSYTTNAGGVVFDIGALAKDASSTVTLVLRLNSTGSAVNSTIASAVEADPNSGNNSVDTVTVVNAAISDMAVSVVGSVNPAPLFGTLTYTVTVTNGGPAAATGVSLTNTLPLGMTNLSVSISPSGSNSVVGNVVTCSLGTLANGATSVVTITGTPGTAGTFTNLAQVGSSLPDSFKGNNSASVKTVVEAPQFNASRSGNVLTISWPSAATGYVLETTTNLQPPVVWVAATNTPSVSGGQNNVNINTSTGAKQFFRLKK